MGKTLLARYLPNYNLPQLHFDYFTSVLNSYKSHFFALSPHTSYINITSCFFALKGHVLFRSIHKFSWANMKNAYALD